MVNYKLTYFDGMGLAESIRILFHYMNQPFTDNRIKREDWPKLKTTMAWGKLPVLEVDGKTVCQSSAIGRYLAKTAGLYGKDNWEALLIDMIIDCAQDMRIEFSAMYRESDETRKEEAKKKLYTETMPYYMGKFDQTVKDNKGYLVNGQFSWADIVLCCMIQMFNAASKMDVTEKYPNLHSLLDKYVNHPKLKAYIASRPKTEF